MTVYIVNIFLTLLISGFAERRAGIDMHGNKRKVSVYAILLLLILWTTIYALRGQSVGADTGNYMKTYISLWRYDSLGEFLDNVRDGAFGYVEYTCYQLFDGDWTPFAFVTGFITYLPVLIIIREESESFTLSALLYIFTLTFYVGMNGTRQAVAMGMIYLAYILLYKYKKYILAVILTAIAFGFHSTALLIAPFFLVSMKSLASSLTKGIIVAFIISFFFLDSLWETFMEFLDRIGQSKLASDYSTLELDGSGLLRLSVQIVPVVLGVWLLRQLRETSKNADRELILLIFSAIFTAFGMYNWIFNRMAVYFSFTTVLFVPKLKRTFGRFENTMGLTIIGALFFAYMISLLLHGDGGYYPYVFNDI